MRQLPPLAKGEQKAHFNINVSKVFFSNNAQDTAYRVQMWGEREPSLFLKTIDYRVCTTVPLFYQYLQEATHITVQILNQRNKTIIGVASFLTHSFIKANQIDSSQKITKIVYNKQFVGEMYISVNLKQIQKQKTFALYYPLQFQNQLKRQKQQIKSQQKVVYKITNKQDIIKNKLKLNQRTKIMANNYQKQKMQLKFQSQQLLLDKKLKEKVLIKIKYLTLPKGIKKIKQIVLNINNSLKLIGQSTANETNYSFNKQIIQRMGTSLQLILKIQNELLKQIIEINYFGIHQIKFKSAKFIFILMVQVEDIFKNNISFQSQMKDTAVKQKQTDLNLYFNKQKHNNFPKNIPQQIQPKKIQILQKIKIIEPAKNISINQNTFQNQTFNKNKIFSNSIESKAVFINKIQKQTIFNLIILNRLTPSDPQCACRVNKKDFSLGVTKTQFFITQHCLCHIQFIQSRTNQVYLQKHIDTFIAISTSPTVVHRQIFNVRASSMLQIEVIIWVGSLNQINSIINAQINNTSAEDLQKQSSQKSWVQQFENSAIASDPQPNISLVQVLSNFLHLPFQITTQDNYISIPSFVQQCLNNITNGNQKFNELQDNDQQTNKQFIQVIASLFSTQQQKVDVILFRQSQIAYKHFFTSITDPRTEVINKLLLADPNCLLTIQKAININILTCKSLKDEMQQTIATALCDAYNISNQRPLPAQQLLDDVMQIKNNKSLLLTNSLLIQMKGLIRNTVESYLADKAALKWEETAINLMSMREIMGQVGLKITLWEALLLIEDLKEKNGCEEDHGEGVLPYDLFHAWTSAISSKKQEGNKKDVEKITKFKMEEIEKIIQGKSMGVSLVQNSQVNNQSDIFNIANLLREKDKLESQQNIVEEQIVQKQIQKDIPINISVQNSINSINSIKAQSIHIKLQPQILFCTVESINIKTKQNAKILFSLPNSQRIQQYLQFVHKRILKLIIDKNQEEQNGLKIQIFQQDTSSEYILPEYIGYLPLQQLKENDKKAVLLYRGNKLTGRIILKLTRQEPILIYPQVWIKIKQKSNYTIQTTIQTIREAFQNQIYRIKCSNYLDLNQIRVIKNQSTATIKLDRLQAVFQEQYSLNNNISGVCEGIVTVKIWRERPSLEQLQEVCNENYEQSTVNIPIFKERSMQKKIQFVPLNEIDPFKRIDRLCKNIQKQYGA